MKQSLPPGNPRWPVGALTALAVWLAVSPVFALTIEDLQQSRTLTPQGFAKYFANFKFERHHQVRPPEVFLATQAGDCDDYATLAARILGEKGYTTRLISVRMPEDIHVVCYIEETRSYLDYNNRRFLIRTVAADGSLKDIANKVARSLGSCWTSVAEFTFRDGVKRLRNAMTQNHPARLEAAR